MTTPSTHGSSSASYVPPTIIGDGDEALGGPPEDTPPEFAPEHPYTVAPGGSITSKRGILAPGEQVQADLLLGGQSALDELVSSGAVIKR